MNSVATIVLCFTLPFLMTTLGALLVFFFHKTSKLANMLTIGLAAGIMLSASIFSLLVPALEDATQNYGRIAFLPVVVGFVLGAAFMVALDFLCAKCIMRKGKPSKKESVQHKFLSKPHEFNKNEALEKKQNKLRKNIVVENVECTQKDDVAENLQHNFKNAVTGNARHRFGKNSVVENAQKMQRQKAFKLFTAITIHNIPEGLSVGFAIGTAVVSGSPLLIALMFAVGIALQNFPEGLATALPIYNCIHKKGRAAFWGIVSGAVEPIFAVAGYFLSAYVSCLLPWLLAFSAGAMIYVIVEEMIPEIHMENKKPIGTWAFVLGFVLMMLLDICL